MTADPLYTAPSTPNPTRRFLTAGELAQGLGCCQKSVRRWALRGKIPAPVIRTKNAALWERADVEHLFAK